MSLGTRITLRGATALALLVFATSVPVAAGKKPPPAQGSANPQITYVDGQKVVVCNGDGSSKVVVYSTREGILRQPRLAARSGDGPGTVFFEESYAPLPTKKILRTRFLVTNGVVGGIATDTVLEVDLAAWPLAISPRGDRVTFQVYNADDSSTLYELSVCDAPPCGLALDDAVAIHTTSPGVGLNTIGGYTANEAAYYFGEWRMDATGAGRERVLRVNVGAGPPYGPAEPVRDFDATLLSLEPSRTDVAGLDTRLLYSIGDRNFVLDTAGGEPIDLGPGHRASWSPDDTKILYLTLSGPGRNDLSGPVYTMELGVPGSAKRLLNYATLPNWAPLP